MDIGPVWTFEIGIEDMGKFVSSAFGELWWEWGMGIRVECTEAEFTYFLLLFGNFG